MNGRQLADAARLHRPGLQIVFVTGYAENAVIGAGQLDAGMRVLTKPFSIEALTRRETESIESAIRDYGRAGRTAGADRRALCRAS